MKCWFRTSELFIYIPTKIARDSQFPLKEGGSVTIEAKPKQRKLIIIKG